MAFFANRVLLGNGIGRVLTEADRNGFFATSGFHMCASRSMARFAAASFHRSARMQHHLAHDRVFKAPVLVLMTGHAGIASDVVCVSARGGRTCPVLCV